MKRLLSSLSSLGALLALVAASAHASTIVYNNATSSSYTLGAVDGINGGNYVADSFSLSSPATIDAISFGNWIVPGTTLESVDWAITTAPFSGTSIGSGDATTFSNVYETNKYGLTANQSTFDIASLPLLAGTEYYLELSASATSVLYCNAYGCGPASAVYWDVSDHSNSTAYDLISQYTDYPGTFALYGNLDNPEVPEPPTLLLLGTGLAGLSLFSIRRREGRVRISLQTGTHVHQVEERGEMLQAS